MTARVLLAMAPLALLAAPAGAQTMTGSPNPNTSFGGTTDTGSNIAVASTGPIDISGAEPELCSVAFDRASATVNLLAVSSQDVGVSIACNSRFRLTARTTNGQLRLENGYSADNARTYVPYDVTWPAGLIDSTGAAIARNFTASGIDWSRGLSAQSGPTRLAQIGTVTVRWGESLNVLAGNYSDTLFLNIEPN